MINDLEEINFKRTELLKKESDEIQPEKDETGIDTLKYLGKVKRIISIIGGTEAAGYFKKLHDAGWVYPAFLSDYFILSKIQAPIEDITLSEERFHLVYFDAFGPDVQPELWTEQIFTQLYKCLKPEGILVTYSCKGNVKRALKSAGFTIEKLPGPKGKREVLRAIKEKKIENH